jgi:hypothetical protein
MALQNAAWQVLSLRAVRLARLPAALAVLRRRAFRPAAVAVPGAMAVLGSGVWEDSLAAVAVPVRWVRRVPQSMERSVPLVVSMSQHHIKTKGKIEMASTATVIDVPTTHWPPVCYLVHLDPPLRRYDVITGEPWDIPYVMFQMQQERLGAHEDAVHLFPSTEDAGFQQEHMMSIGKLPPARTIDKVLEAMGYEVVN